MPIPNTEVKLPSAHDTWRGTARESGSLPVLFFRPYGQAVKTPPFHGGNSGSIPDRVTKETSGLRLESGVFVCFLKKINVCFDIKI